MRRRTTHLFNGLSILPGFLGNLRRLVSQLDHQRLVLGRRTPLELVLLRSRRRLLPLLARLARRGRAVRVRLPFPLPPEAPAAPEERVKAPGKSRPDGTTLPVRVGGCLAPHWRRWQAIGAESWVVTVLQDSYRVPFKDSSSPFSHPGIVSDVPARLSSGSSLAARDRGDACQRSPRNRPRSRSQILQPPLPGGESVGSRLLQLPLPGGESVWWLETRDRSLAPERLCPADVVKDGNSRFCTVICQRGGFSSFPGFENAYFQTPIHRSSRKLLRFTSEGTVYQFRALCFRLSTAPQVFTRVFAVVSVWAHTHGIRLLHYLDDWLVLSSSEREAKQAVQ